jgi:hypothetical protein
MRNAIAFRSRRRRVSESSRSLGEGSYIPVYILLITSVLIIVICCRCYFR